MSGKDYGLGECGTDGCTRYDCGLGPGGVILCEECGDAAMIASLGKTCRRVRDSLGAPEFLAYCRGRALEELMNPGGSALKAMHYLDMGLTHGSDAPPTRAGYVTDAQSAADANAMVVAYRDCVVEYLREQAMVDDDKGRAAAADALRLMATCLESSKMSVKVVL